jgi:hypothetical protein
MVAIGDRWFYPTSIRSAVAFLLGSRHTYRHIQQLLQRLLQTSVHQPFLHQFLPTDFGNRQHTWRGGTGSRIGLGNLRQ